MKELSNKTIESLWIDAEDEFLLFRTNFGDIGYVTVGDCCSDTWFADILGVPFLLGGRVDKVEEIDLPDYNVEDGRCRQECDSVYCYRITTDKGIADVIFRNSSNGYYGGEVLFTEGKEPDGMKQITEDWSAN